jgi:hypothetical protein
MAKPLGLVAEHLKNRRMEFVMEDGVLVRRVTADDGGYQHRCSLEVYEKVACAVEEAVNGTTLIELRQNEDVPFTQANLALEFLKERGIAEVRHRRTYSASTDVYLDAMIEWHALDHKARTGEDTGVS